jgi:hypothetical protein
VYTSALLLPIPLTVSLSRILLRARRHFQKFHITFSVCIKGSI